MWVKLFDRYLSDNSAMKLLQKLEILADAAKYDASCSSSGTATKDSLGGKGVGSTGGMGICHSYAPDGRCISLLKILLTNFCIYECSYCINRNSSNVQRARFNTEEVVNLTLDFYKRNYIEGLFLSSGIIQTPDYTMDQIVEVARSLREDHDFRGYIHLKTIPDADGDLLARAGLYADRLSINVELPTQQALIKLAPEKDSGSIENSMQRIKLRRDENIAEIKADKKITNQRKSKKPLFSPGGQSTQMIIGAEPSTDADILQRSSGLYNDYKLKRVYYSAFSPIPDASVALPLVQPPLMREHRLYQSDWLMRFYGYTANEITAESIPVAGGSAANMLDLEIDPKLAWALRNRAFFPINVNKASREMLLRIPGLGVKTVNKIIQIRRWHSIRLEDLVALRAPVKRAMPFIICSNHHPQVDVSSENLRNQFITKKANASTAVPSGQMSLAL